MAKTIDDIIAEIHNEWNEDCRIDESNLVYECSRTPILHSKYLNKLIEMKKNRIEYDLKITELREARKLYFQGKLGKEELQKYNWEQYQYNASTKVEAEKKAESTPEVTKYKRILSKIDVAIESLTEIMRGIKDRGFLIRSMIDMKKFNAGEF